MTLPLAEALTRLALDDPMEVRIEMLPNTGYTAIEQWPRSKVEARVKLNTPFESGATAQRMDFGVHVHVTIFNGPNGAQGLARVFFKTKPECRLTPEQLEESLKRGHGTALFSGPDHASKEQSGRAEADSSVHRRDSGNAQEV
jgi:hypothetical protein